MSNRVTKVCCSYGDIVTSSVLPATLVTAERWSTAIAFLTQLPEDNLVNDLREQDERLLGAYRRAFGGKLNRREAIRLLGCLGWVPF
jgi:hypothetical protein